MLYHARTMKLKRVKKLDLSRERRVAATGSLGNNLPQESAEPIPVPDVLNLEPRISGNQDAVHELLELAFFGRDDAKGIERQLSAFRGTGTGWSLDQFAEDLFVKQLIRSCFTIRIGGLSQIGGLSFPIRRPTSRRCVSYLEKEN